MTEEFFSDPVMLQRLKVGPLAPYITKFAALLSEQGYAKSTTKGKIRLVADFSQWLRKQKVGIQDLDEQLVSNFLKHLQKHKHIYRGHPATLRVLLQQLRDAGVIPASAKKIDDNIFHLVKCDFAQYLVQERGLSRPTLLNYLPIARHFLSERFGRGSILLNELRPPDVTGFILRNAYTVSPGRAKLMTTALRIFFRFLYIRGEIPIDLSESVLSVADWRLSTLPKSLEQEQVECLLKSCDQNSSIGHRDYTILLLLARLGLRAGEVVAMTLDDIDWEAGELTIRGKGAQQDRLPIAHDVGEALATYLQHGRPPCSTRLVFIRMKAPRQGFSSSVAICNIVRRALARTELNPPRKGAHLLRHSLATRMLQKGASLSEIGDILRHQLPNTTEIYAKVDLEALRALAQPWPGGDV